MNWESTKWESMKRGHAMLKLDNDDVQVSMDEPIGDGPDIDEEGDTEKFADEDIMKILEPYILDQLDQQQQQNAQGSPSSDKENGPPAPKLQMKDEPKVKVKTPNSGKRNEVHWPQTYKGISEYVAKNYKEAMYILNSYNFDMSNMSEGERKLRIIVKFVLVDSQLEIATSTQDMESCLNDVKALEEMIDKFNSSDNRQRIVPMHVLLNVKYYYKLALVGEMVRELEQVENLDDEDLMVLKYVNGIEKVVFSPTNPNNFKDLMIDWQSKCNEITNMHVKYSCKYHKCAWNRRDVFEQDIHFTGLFGGMVQTMCDEGCKTDYHLLLEGVNADQKNCFDLMNRERNRVLSEKGGKFVFGPCVTPDCQGTLTSFEKFDKCNLSTGIIYSKEEKRKRKEEQQQENGRETQTKKTKHKSRGKNKSESKWEQIATQGKKENVVDREMPNPVDIHFSDNSADVKPPSEPKPEPVLDMNAPLVPLNKDEEGIEPWTAVVSKPKNKKKKKPKEQDVPLPLDYTFAKGDTETTEDSHTHRRRIESNSSLGAEFDQELEQYPRNDPHSYAATADKKARIDCLIKCNEIGEIVSFIFSVINKNGPQQLSVDEKRWVDTEQAPLLNDVMVEKGQQGGPWYKLGQLVDWSIVEMLKKQPHRRFIIEDTKRVSIPEQWTDEPPQGVAEEPERNFSGTGSRCSSEVGLGGSASSPNFRGIAGRAGTTTPPMMRPSPSPSPGRYGTPPSFMHPMQVRIPVQHPQAIRHSAPFVPPPVFSGQFGGPVPMPTMTMPVNNGPAMQFVPQHTGFSPQQVDELAQQKNDVIQALRKELGKEQQDCKTIKDLAELRLSKINELEEEVGKCKEKTLKDNYCKIEALTNENADLRAEKQCIDNKIEAMTVEMAEMKTLNEALGHRNGELQGEMQTEFSKNQAYKDMLLKMKKQLGEEKTLMQQKVQSLENEKSAKDELLSHANRKNGQMTQLCENLSYKLRECTNMGMVNSVILQLASMQSSTTQLDADATGDGQPAPQISVASVMSEARVASSSARRHTSYVSEQSLPIPPTCVREASPATVLQAPPIAASVQSVNPQAPTDSTKKVHRYYEILLQLATERNIAMTNPHEKEMGEATARMRQVRKQQNNGTLLAPDFSLADCASMALDFFVQATQQHREESEVDVSSVDDNLCCVCENALVAQGKPLINCPHCNNIFHKVCYRDFIENYGSCAECGK